MPLKQCGDPTCAELLPARGPSRCEKHRQQDTRTREERPTTYDDRRWRRFRKFFIAQHPLCADCEEEGVVTPTEELHHMLAIRDGGPKFDPANCRPLCKVHHSIRTAGERKRWRKEKQSAKASA